MTFQKLSPLRVPKFLLERVDNTEKRGNDIFFIYFTNELHLRYVCGKIKFSFIMFQSFELTMQDSHPSPYNTKTLYMSNQLS